MTIEIRELVVRVEVAESSPQMSAESASRCSELSEQRLLEQLKREVMEYLQERGAL